MAKNDKTDTAVADTGAKVEKVVAVAEAVPEHVSFDQWWMTMSKKLKLLGHMKEILHADFTARGLSKNEPKHKFDNAMKLFGYKW